MKKEIIELKSGSLEQVTYFQNDNSSFLKILISELRQLIGFNEDCKYIQFVKPNKGKSISDVLKEFSSSVSEDDLFLADSIMIKKDLPPYQGITESESIFVHLDNMCTELMESNFSHVYFSRCTMTFNRVSEVFILNNKKGKSFMKSYEDVIDRIENMESH